MLHQIDDATSGVGSYDRNAARHGLVDYQSPWVGVGREHQRLGQSVINCELLAVGESGKPDGAGMDRGGSAFQFRLLNPVPNEKQSRSLAQLGRQLRVGIQEI